MHFCRRGSGLCARSWRVLAINCAAGAVIRIAQGSRSLLVSTSASERPLRFTVVTLIVAPPHQAGEQRRHTERAGAVPPVGRLGDERGLCALIVSSQSRRCRAASIGRRGRVFSWSSRGKNAAPALARPSRRTNRRRGKTHSLGRQVDTLGFKLPRRKRTRVTAPRSRVIDLDRKSVSPLSTPMRRFVMRQSPRLRKTRETWPCRFHDSRLKPI